MLREAYHWDDDRPRWYQDMDRVFNGGGETEFLSLLNDKRNVLVGVFDPELTAIIMVVLEGYGVFESHLLARRGANAETIVIAAHSILYDLLEFDLQELYVWVAKRHISVKRLCDNIGLLPDGVRMFKGQYRGRLIEWERRSIRRENLLAEKAA